MVLEFMSGGELFTIIRKVGRFPENITVFYASEILLALEYIHKQNAIYRDLKPENIMLSAEGHIKLTDLGFAKGGMEYGKKTYTFCGTYEYLAPEIIKESGHDKASDWWSFVLYS